MGAAALYKAVRVVAIGHNFPPPPGSDTWDEAAVFDVAHSFLAGPRGVARMTELAMRADDDRSFARLLDTAVLNHLRDLARRTDRGRLIRRLKEVMTEDDQFSQGPAGADWWHLSNGPASASTTPLDSIAPQLEAIDVVVPRWTSEERNAPVADRPSLVALMAAALAAAGGALTDADLAKLVAGRIDTRRSPLTVELDTAEGVSEPAALGFEPDELAIGRAEAIKIFNNLSDVSRIILTDPDRPVRQIGLDAGIGKSQAHTHRQRLLDDLRSRLDQSEDSLAVLNQLTELCVTWLEARTLVNGSTSVKKHADEGGG